MKLFGSKTSGSPKYTCHQLLEAEPEQRPLPPSQTRALKRQSELETPSGEFVMAPRTLLQIWLLKNHGQFFIWICWDHLLTLEPQLTFPA